MKRTTLLKSLLLLCALVAGSSSVWAETKTGINLTNSQTALTFTDFSTAGTSYSDGDDKSLTLPADDGNSYQYWTGNYIMKENSTTSTALQMKKDDASNLVSPTITTTAGFTVTIEYKSNGSNGPTIKIGSDDATTMGKASSKTSKNFETTLTSATITINALPATTYIYSIKITPKKPERTLSAITLSGDYKTVFFQDENFSYEGLIVTASFEESSVADAIVTPTSVSTPDMTTTGVKEVTVSYTEGEVTKTASYNITVKEKEKFTVTFSDGGSLTEESIGGGITLPVRSNIGNYEFKGWAVSEISSLTTTAPNVLTGTYHPESHVTLYPVYALSEYGTPASTLTQTHQYDTWTYSGATTDKTSYRMFSKDSYILSDEFDLSKLAKVVVYGGGSFGTLPSGQTKQFTISDGTTVWKTVETSGTSSTNQVNVTSTVSLSGTGKIRIISDCGASGSSGLRFSKVEIYTMETPVTTYYISTPSATITLNVACTDGIKYYGTYSNGAAFVVPADLTVTEIDASTGTLSLSNYSTGDIVPANTGVMVASTTAGDHTVTLATGGTSKLGASNSLYPSGDLGIDADHMHIDNTKFYRLTMHNGTSIGFWWGAADGAAFAIAANKAYLAVPSSAASAAGFTFDGETTGINTLNAERGTLNGECYNLAGQRFAQPTKGLYIVNGRKVVIK